MRQAGRLAAAQRKLRQARLLVVAASEESPVLRDELTDAIASLLRGEEQAAEILRESFRLKR